MAVLELPVRSDFKAYSFQTELDGVVYTLTFRFNDRMSLWVMDIGDSSGNEILNGILLQTDVALTDQYVKEDLPPGRFICIDESGESKDAGVDDLGNDVKLLYEEAT